MSFFRKLFGGSKRQGAGAAQPALNLKGAEIEYNGFIIRATPYLEGGQYQSCGVICKEIDGEMREHRFIRADRFAGVEDAVLMIHTKARQIINEQGDKIFL